MEPVSAAIADARVQLRLGGLHVVHEKRAVALDEAHHLMQLVTFHVAFGEGKRDEADKFLGRLDVEVEHLQLMWRVVRIGDRRSRGEIA